MKLFFLGTASAEGYPAPFCECINCREARKEGEKSLRLRSSLIIDNELLVDFGPDLLSYTLKYDIHFSLIKILLITHSHYDHLFLNNFNYILPETGTILTKPPNLDIICSRDVYKNVKCSFEKCEKDIPWKIKVIKEFKTVFSHHFKITALPAAHMLNEEKAFFYIVQKEGKTILLAFDTGMWGEEIWHFLKNYFFDVLVLDETMGYKNYREHLNIEEIFIIKEKLIDQKTIDQNSLVIVTHVSHNYNPCYSKLKEIFDPEGIIVAFDGMEVNI
ncbi:hypothetical protein CVT91_07170 [Candidatus Atribacteria bacterium HGW-Atribacteria-1]|nr:MAG: hypothetical protein CVT91_07170 [Candidatus Atribacteria bacterium HGW-Atribacteria-1]